MTVEGGGAQLDPAALPAVAGRGRAGAGRAGAGRRPEQRRAGRPDAAVLGHGRNRRLQHGDPSTHAETAAFHGGHDWLAHNGAQITAEDDPSASS